MRRTATTDTQGLEQQIEELVRQHIAACRDAAAAAVERAFGAASNAQTKTPRVRKRKGFVRRAPDQMSALSERLYQAVCAKPGETMSVLAPLVGAAPRELQVPGARLKRAGRIRTVGQRQLTRYFPMAENGTRSR